MQLGPSETINQPAEEPSVIEQPQVNDSTDTTSTALQTGETSTKTQDPVAIQRLIDRITSGESLLPNVLLIGGILLAVIILMRLVRKNYKASAKRSNAQSSPSKRITDIHSAAQASITPATKAMVDAEEMARRVGAILDNKAARLELLIEEADAKLNILNRSLAGSPTPQPPEPIQPPAQPVQPTRTIDPSLLDRARLEQDQAERQTRVAGRIEPTIQESKPEPIAQEPKSIQERVIELSAAGVSNIDIAHQLNYPIGQVELILNLRKQQG